MLVSAKEMQVKAKAGHYAVGQFNINNLEWTKAVLAVAQEMQAPVILGVSEGAGKYMTGFKVVADMVKAMDELREQGCTFVIASCHWGRETYYQLDGNQAYGVKLIDAGFDMVYGTGSHTCQMIRWYKGKLIFYSLSNFTFGANAAPKDDDTVVVQISYDIQEDGTLTAAELHAIPFKMHRDRDFRPWPIEDEDGKRTVWEKLYYNGYAKTRKAKPAPSLPESFLTTGYVNFRELPIVE